MDVEHMIVAKECVGCRLRSGKPSRTQSSSSIALSIQATGLLA